MCGWANWGTGNQKIEDRKEREMIMSLTERKDRLMAQLRLMREQKTQVEGSLQEITVGIERVTGALMLVQEMEAEGKPTAVSQETSVTP